MNLNGTLTATPLEALSLHALGDYQFPPVDWIVDGLLPSGALVLLVGRPKAGKSLLTLDLAASVALGEPFLDKATEQGPAIYVPAEDALRLVRDRLWIRLGDTERDAPLFVVPVDGSLDQSLRLDDAGSFARLAATIERYRPRLLVLDPLREFHRQRENEADDMAALLRPLRQLAHELDVLIVLVHHRNKSASDAAHATRGSSAIAGGVDAIITLDLSAESEDDGLTPDQTLTLRMEGRYGPRQRLSARLRSGLRWEVVDALHDGDLSTAQRILRHLEATGETIVANDLIDPLKSSKTAVQRAVSTLYKDGKLDRCGAGTKSSPFRYCAAGYRARQEEWGEGWDEYSRASTEQTAHSYRPETAYTPGGGTNPQAFCTSCNRLLGTAYERERGIHRYCEAEAAQ